MKKADLVDVVAQQKNLPAAAGRGHDRRAHRSRRRWAVEGRAHRPARVRRLRRSRIRGPHGPQSPDRRADSDRRAARPDLQGGQGAAGQGQPARLVAPLRCQAHRKQRRTSKARMGTRLFIGNLSYNVNEQELREAFTGEGIELRSVRVALDRDTGRPRGFAFVETMTDDGAKASIEKLSGRILQGRPIIVEEAQAKPTGPRPGGRLRVGGPRPGGFGRPRAPGAGPAGPGAGSGRSAARGPGGFGGRVLRARRSAAARWLRPASRPGLRRRAGGGASIRAVGRSAARRPAMPAAARAPREEEVDPPQARGARAGQLALERQSRRGLRPAANGGGGPSVVGRAGDA